MSFRRYQRKQLITSWTCKVCGWKVKQAKEPESCPTCTLEQRREEVRKEMERANELRAEFHELKGLRDVKCCGTCKFYREDIDYYDGKRTSQKCVYSPPEKRFKEVLGTYTYTESYQLCNFYKKD